MMSDEVIEEILFRLPIKPLIRCKLLSKTWCLRIQERLLQSDPQFLGFFFTDNTLHKVGFSPASAQGTKLQSGEGTWGSTYPLHNSDRRQTIQVLTSSNGFLLCSWQIECPVDYIICNPITRQWATLPKSTLPKPNFDSKRDVSHLLICDPSDCYSSLEKVKYKVIRVVWKTFCREKETVVRLEIFSSSGTGWKELRLTCQSSFFYHGYNGMHLLGNIPVLLREEDKETVFYFPVRANGDFVINHVAIFYTGRKHIELFQLPPHLSFESFGFGQTEGNVSYVANNLDHFEIWTLDEMRAEWHPKQKITSTQIPVLLQGHGTPEDNRILGIIGLHVTPEDNRMFSVMGVHPTNPKLILAFFYATRKLRIYDAEASTMSIVHHYRLDLDPAVFYVWPHWPSVWLKD